MTTELRTHNRMPHPINGDNWLNVLDYGVSGSAFETQAATKAGSNRIKVDSPGDFRTGQEVVVSRCHVCYDEFRIRPADSPYSKGIAVADELELRGYNSEKTHWSVFVLEIDGNGPLTFRWSNTLAVSWQEQQIPVTG